MATILCVAGHGKQPDGSFDTGAKGLITKGENHYMRENLFPVMRKYLPDNHNVRFFEAHDCYGYGDIVAQANKYGSDTIVCEFHYDAGGSSATGGHVIIHKDFQPDNTDKAIVSAIQQAIGLSNHTHQGMRGLSGRDDLGNVNRTYFNDVNYRLIEVGFGTNANDVDVMMNYTDKLAKELVKALCGEIKQEEQHDEVLQLQGDDDMILVQCDGRGIALLCGGRLAGFANIKDVEAFLAQGIKLVKVSEATFNNFYNDFKK